MSSPELSAGHFIAPARLPIRTRARYNASNARFLWEGIGRLNVRLSAPKMKIVDRVKKALA
jgi:hypothetical protein